jgi:hypothetical protein
MTSVERISNPLSASDIGSETEDVRSLRKASLHFGISEDQGKRLEGWILTKTSYWGGWQKRYAL